MMVERSTPISLPPPQQQPLGKNGVPVIDSNPFAPPAGPSANSSLSAFLGGIRPEDLYKQMRPWSSFFAGDRFSRPASVDELTARLRTNPRAFLFNYIAVCLVLLVYCAYPDLHSFIFYAYLESHTGLFCLHWPSLLALSM